MGKKEILTSRQKQAIDLFVADKNFADYYLSGGTALSAFYLHHRLSDDLDFFIDKTVDYHTVLNFAEKLKTALGAKELRYEKLFDRNIFFFQFARGEELKIEFTKYPFRHLGRVVKRGNLRVDSLRDLAANKFMAMLDRFDPKDFADMYFLLQKFSLEKIKHDAEKKFGAKIGPMLLGSEFAKVRRITALPIMFRDLTVTELKEFFARKALEIGKSIV